MLFLRDLPLQAGFTVIDAASMPALARLHKPRRALGMYSLFLSSTEKGKLLLHVCASHSVLRVMKCL